MYQLNLCIKKNIKENRFIITLTAVVFGLIGYLFGKQCQKNQCPMMAKGMHKTHAMHMKKTNGDKVYVWKSDEMIDHENLEISIDTLSGSKQVKVIVKKEKEEQRVFISARRVSKKPYSDVFVTLNKSKVMEHISLFFQIVVAVSVLIVWVFRYHNVIAEFEQFGFSDVFRNFVGASKISISTLLLTGIWYAELTPYAAMGMAAFMLAAQLSHLRVKNPFLQRLPSLVFLLMSVFVALFHYGVI